MTLQINIDNGGTLTDICILTDTGVKKTKVLTTPYDLSNCFFEGLKKASGVLYGEPNVQRLLEEVDLIRYSTTQGTNAICERKGPKLGLITSLNASGLPEQLEQHDADLYRALVGTRVSLLDTDTLSIDHVEMEIVKSINALTAAGANRIVVSFADKNFEALENIFRKVVLRKYPRHLLGAVPTLYGSDLSVDTDPIRRTWTALINSFLHPAMEQFLFNAENRLRGFNTKNPLLIFRNDGDASRVAKTVAMKTYSSGPRGGMEGMKSFALRYGMSDVVAIDVGGTTTDIGQCIDGNVAEVRRGRVEGISVSFPLSKITSAGAGGSSVFKVVEKKIVIGPDSVGAVPGPAAFGRGGTQATITDASLLCGLFDPKSYFGGGMQLDLDRAATAIAIHIATPLGLAPDEALRAMESAYESKIAEEVLRVTQVSQETVLLAFGGAGPLNACGVAEKAGINRVAVPYMAAVFSAFGIGTCDVSHRYSAVLDTDQRIQACIDIVLAELSLKAGRDMFAEGFQTGDYTIESRLVIVDGRGEELILQLENASFYLPALAKAHSAELEVTAIKRLRQDAHQAARFAPIAAAASSISRHVLTRDQGRRDVPVYRLEDLKPGDFAQGPAILEEDFFTCKVLDGWTFVISDHQDILLNRKAQA
ncbi:Acetophenone carboxylase alpha subunit [Pseudomonas fluorescens]|nr:Acetophenone carboxylase alpha subunit [Pseudomonas fluorescens]